MTALPGAGAFARGTADPDPEPDADEPPVEEDDELELLLGFWSLSCCANGSLLANRLNEASCPSSADAVDAMGEAPPVVTGDWSLPPSVGAASVGVPVGVVVLAGGGGAAEGCSFFSTRGTWNTSRPTNRTPRTAATIFCFFCFAFSGSTVLLAITGLLSPTRWSTSYRWSWSRSSSWIRCLR